MANAYITVDKYEKLLKRVEELEHREVGVPIDIDREVNELKEDYHEIKKDVAVTDTKIDSVEKVMNERFNGLEGRMDERFNTLDEKFTGKFDSLEKRFTMLWALQVATFLAILAIFGTLIGIMFKLFGVI